MNRGDVGDVDFHDVVTSTLASRFKVGFAGKAVTEGLNALTDFKWEGGLTNTLYGNKSVSATFLNATFGYLKIGVGAIGEHAKATKESVDAMKVI